jgi:hypothetical protein
MVKMFTYQGKTLRTWNPFVGCSWDCSYCWARGLAETKLKNSYPNGFVPQFHPDRLKTKFKPDEFVFCVSMGDISFAPKDVTKQICDVVKDNPATKFLFCTKQPAIYARPEFNEISRYSWGSFDFHVLKPFAISGSAILAFFILLVLRKVIIKKIKDRLPPPSP